MAIQQKDGTDETNRDNPKKACAEEEQDNEGKKSTPKKNKKFKAMGTQQDLVGRWITGAFTAREEDSVKARGNHARKIDDTREIKHSNNFHDDPYDAETVKGQTEEATSILVTK